MRLVTDSQRAGVGLVAGAAIGVSITTLMRPRWPRWLAAPVAVILVGANAVAGAEAVLAVGDWWDRR